MKAILSKISSALLILVLLTACSSDDSGNNVNNQNNNGGTVHLVEYKLTTSAPVITGITYKNAEGNVVSATENLSGLTSWNKTVNVSNNNFVAVLQFESNAPVGSPISYSMQIVVDGEVKHTDMGATSGNSDMEISYDFSNL